LNFSARSFSNALSPPRPSSQRSIRLSDFIVEAGGYSGRTLRKRLSSLAVTWSTDTHREQLIDRFWLNFRPRKIRRSCAARMSGAYRFGVAPYARANWRMPARRSSREARNIVLNYARRIEHADASARRSVAAGLNELGSIIESLWPNQLRKLSRGAMKALDAEKSPETAALLAAFVESWAHCRESRRLLRIRNHLDRPGARSSR